jgi:hypothetical protein
MKQKFILKNGKLTPIFGITENDYKGLHEELKDIPDQYLDELVNRAETADDEVYRMIFEAVKAEKYFREYARSIDKKLK